MSPTYLPIIGLEIHVELSTKSKMFCQCDASWQEYAPNENTCPVCLGMPGALPVPNKEAVERTIRLALALGCQINLHSHFDRKHYFYADLPKGYQISQYDEPIGINGKVPVKYRSTDGTWTTRTFHIHRVHLEEDTGKLTHVGHDSVVDFNRSSVPLVEIVTEADFRSSDEVKAYLQELHTIIRCLDVSEADMERGSMRMEPNISVKQVESHQVIRSSGPLDPSEFPPYKVEVKNINSFNFVKKAVDYEIKRHIELLEKGETPIQETRGWDDTKSVTFSQRVKEAAADYRYFPEPDIPPMIFEESHIEKLRLALPVLPYVRMQSYMNLGIREDVAFTLTRDAEVITYFESLVDMANGAVKPVDLASLLVNKKIDRALSPAEFVKKAAEILAPKQTDMGKLAEVITKVLEANPKSVTDYQAGKTNAIMFLVGQVMKQMGGKADAGVVKGELEKKLGEN